MKSGHSFEEELTIPLEDQKARYPFVLRRWRSHRLEGRSPEAAKVGERLNRPGFSGGLLFRVTPSW
jgi:hypothetical protein